MSEPVPTVNHMVDGQLVDSSLAPSDRTFRNAWKLDGGAIVVDMPKARELHRNKLREMRKPLLEALDTEYMRLDEGTLDNGQAGSSAKLAKKAIAVKKQALRDVTTDPAIEAATTPEQLKAVIPAALL